MTQAEAPTFIHTEAERTQMLARMQEIASSYQISAKVLEEVGWLILERDAQEEWDKFDGNDMFDGDMLLPERGEPRISLGPAMRGDHFNITILDGIDRNASSGEIVRLSEDEKRGGLRWRVGIFDTIYSETLGRRIQIEARDIVMAVDPLSLAEHAILAKRLVDNYVMGLVQP